MIRTLQQKIVALQQENAVNLGDPEAMIKVYAETTIIRLMKDGAAGNGGRIAGAFGYFRDTGRFVLFEAPAVVLATGGIGKTFSFTSNSWEYTGDGHALALLAGATLLNMEFVQFHPTHMVWPLSWPACWSPSRCAATAACCATPRASGSCTTTSLTCSARCTPRPRRRPTAGTTTRPITGARPNCCPGTRWPGRLGPRSRRAAGHRTAACSSTSPPGEQAEEILRKLPSMYHQFKELADVDITKEPMEVGPAQHYVMGGVEVDPDTGASCVPGLYAAGEVSGGMHGSNRLGGNSLSDLLVFGRRAGMGAGRLRGNQPGQPARGLGRGHRRGASRRGGAAESRDRGENPYTVHAEVQETDERPRSASSGREDRDRGGAGGAGGAGRRGPTPCRLHRAAAPRSWPEMGAICPKLATIMKWP